MASQDEVWISRQLKRLANALCDRPRSFLVPQLILFAVCLVYSLNHLQFSAKRTDLVSEHLKYQRDFLEFKREFQVPDALVAVVESESLEKNRRFVERLASKLHLEPGLFAGTYYKGDLRLMGRKGLLFLPEETLEELRRVLRDQWSFIEIFARASNHHDLFRAVNRQLREAEPDKMDAAEVEQLLPAMRLFRRALDEAAHAILDPLPHSFPGLAALFGGQTKLYVTFAGGQIYALVTHAARAEVEEQAVHRLRALVRETRDEIGGVNAGISGEPVLNFDEMSQARLDISLATILSVVLVALIFIYGFDEIARPLLATLSLVIGVGYALGFGTLTVGRLNILSITLLPILIGLAIDFGVHLVSRYEEELSAGCNRRQAVGRALACTGTGILASGLATAGAFFAMMLTDFKGIKEMGLLCGGGLILCLAAMVTLLPLFLAAGNPEAREKTACLSRRRRRDRIERSLLNHPRAVLVTAAVLTLLSLAQARHIRFDYNLLNLQSSGLPAVGIEEKLLRGGSQSMLYGAVLADSLEDARALEEKIERLEPVAGVSSLVDYLTEDQSEKLRIIREVKERAEGLELPPLPSEPVDPRDLNDTLFATQGYLGLALEDRPEDDPLAREISALRQSVIELRSLLDPNDAATVSSLGTFQTALFANVHETIAIVRGQDVGGRLTLEDIPLFMRERYISATGKFLLQVYPKADLWERPNQEPFIAALRSVDPNVTGTLIQVYEYTTLIKENFLLASVFAGAIIAAILLFQFRRLASVLLAFLPVFLGLSWMLGLMGFLEMTFNPVNIMALAVLIGIGITSGIHIISRFIEDPRALILTRSTGKAVIVSAFTTMAGFGSLMIAKHQGIASLGRVMTLGTALCMIASLAVLPAVLTLITQRRSGAEKRP
jgi:hopanoid biosynthesis associated RND transporter like protein HpnN